MTNAELLKIVFDFGLSGVLIVQIYILFQWLKEIIKEKDEMTRKYIEITTRQVIISENILKEVQELKGKK